MGKAVLYGGRPLKRLGAIRGEIITRGPEQEPEQVRVAVAATVDEIEAIGSLFLEWDPMPFRVSDARKTLGSFRGWIAAYQSGAETTTMTLRVLGRVPLRRR